MIATASILTEEVICRAEQSLISIWLISTPHWAHKWNDATLMDICTRASFKKNEGCRHHVEARLSHEEIGYHHVQ